MLLSLEQYWRLDYFTGVNGGDAENIGDLIAEGKGEQLIGRLAVEDFSFHTVDV